MTIIAIPISSLLYYSHNDINSKTHTTYPKIKDNMTNLMYNSYRALR